VLCTTRIRVEYYAILQQDRMKRFSILDTDKKQIGYYAILEQNIK
jgi:hypothetical protein